MIYLQLFLSFLKIGLFGFGGGLAVLSLIQHEVESHGWMTQEQFVDIVAVSQVTPGPIGINCATYAGYLATGNAFGSALATFALVLPSFIIMMLLIAFMSKKKDNKYNKGENCVFSLPRFLCECFFEKIIFFCFLLQNILFYCMEF